MNFKQFLGVPPHEPAPNILPELNRRNFLKSVGSIAVATAVGSFSNDVEAAQFQPNSKIDIEALRTLLNNNILTHPKPDNKRIFNDPKILELNYKSGDFTYYEPHNPNSSPYKKKFLSKFNQPLEKYDQVLEDSGYKVVESKSDFVFVAEIENAGSNDSLYYNGMVIVKKGTKIVRKNVGTTEKPVFQNWIHDCFNPVYAMSCITK